MKNVIFINGNVASSKNGRTFNMKTKISLDSKSTQKYKKTSKDDFVRLKDTFLKELENKTKPYKIGFHFVRDSRRKYDWVNPVQTMQDLMVKYGWLDDDNVNEMFPIPLEIDGALTSLDRENPGCYIKIL